MYSAITGKPGMLTSYIAQPRNIFFGNRVDARYIPGPVTVDGTLTKNASNSPYNWLIFAGTLMGKVTSSGKYANSVMGLTSGAASASATTVSTDVNTAAELVRRVGASGTFTLTGAATAGGTMHSETVTYSAVNLSTGAITCSAITNAYVVGSMIQPTDGSQTIITLVADDWGTKTIDTANTSSIDVYDPMLWAGGGIVNTAYIVNFPPDASARAYVKAAIRANIPDAKFQDDLINS